MPLLCAKSCVFTFMQISAMISPPRASFECIVPFLVRGFAVRINYRAYGLYNKLLIVTDSTYYIL